MADVTYFVVLPFFAGDDGACPGEAVACTSANAAITRAEALSRKDGHVDTVAFSRTGDLAVGEFSDASVLRAFGDVPSDLTKFG